MTEPVENALRRSLAAHAQGGDPGVDLAAVHRLARRRRGRRRAVVGAAAGLVVALLAGPALLPAEDRARDRLDVAGQRALEPGELTRRVLDVLGDNAQVVAEEEPMAVGPIDPEEALIDGPQTRLGGRIVTILVAREQEWLYTVRWEAIEPAPTERGLREGLRDFADGAAELASADVGEGRGYAVPMPQGVAAAAISSRGTVVGVDVVSSGADTSRAALAESALEVLAELGP